MAGALDEDQQSLKSLGSQGNPGSRVQQNVFDGVEAEGPEIVEPLWFLLHECFPNFFRNISALPQDMKTGFC
jgi:hypothetical protein